MRAWWRRFWPDFVEGYRYVRDPHGWELRRRQLVAERFRPRPGMFLNSGTIIVHPAAAHLLIRDLGGMVARPEERGALFADTPGRLAGMDVYVSVHAVENPPDGGWPDVAAPPERPRLAP